MRAGQFTDIESFQNDPHWHDLLPFHEYFHCDTGRGLGRSPQFGWDSWFSSMTWPRIRMTVWIWPR